MTDKTQAILPVTQEARKASRRFYDETDADLSDATLEKLDAAFARFGFALLDSIGKTDTVDIEGRLEGYTPPESQQDWDCVAALQTIRNQRLRLAAADTRQSHSLPGDVGMREALAAEISRKIARVHPTHHDSAIPVTIKISRTYAEMEKLIAALTSSALSGNAGEVRGLRALLQEFVEAMERYQMDVDGDATPRHRDMMARGRSALAGEG